MSGQHEKHDKDDEIRKKIHHDEMLSFDIQRWADECYVKRTNSTLLCYISLSYFHLEENGPKINNLCLTSNTIDSNSASNSHTTDPHVTWGPVRAPCRMLSKSVRRPLLFKIVKASTAAVTCDLQQVGYSLSNENLASSQDIVQIEKCVPGRAFDSHQL